MSPFTCLAFGGREGFGRVRVSEQKSERVPDGQHVVNHLPILQVFGTERCTAAFERGRDDEAVVKRVAIAAGYPTSVLNGSSRVDVEMVVGSHLIQHGLDFRPTELKLLGKDIGGLLQHLSADHRLVFRHQVLGDLLFLEVKVGVSVNDDVGVEEVFIAHWLLRG